MVGNDLCKFWFLTDKYTEIMNYEKEIDKIVDKCFRYQNNDGLGFLTTEMNECKKEMKALVEKLNLHFVSNNEVAVCDCRKPVHNRIDNSNYCHRCGGIIMLKQTDC